MSSSGNETAEPAGARPRREAREGGGEWLGMAALAAVWLPFFWKISPAWSASVEQAHGWAVPLLAAYFWRERSGAADGKVRITHKGGKCVIRTLGAGGAAGLALALTVLEANPLWPLAQWAGYGAAAMLTVAFVAVEGGWGRARRFWFPIFFVSTALAWPTAATVRLQAALVEMNTQLAATVVSALGFPAVVSGNAIEVASGFVGVDEACSGVRSWQATWMAGWFFGELLGLGAARRVGLVAGALAAAVAGNLIRTTLLTWLAAAQGPAASARWHDDVGTAEMIFVLASVAGLAWRLGKRKRAGEMVRPLEEGEVTARTGWRVAAIAAGLVAASAPTVWYRWHEARAGGGGPVQWELRAPEAGWRAIELPEATRNLLRATASGGFEKRAAATGARTTVLLVRWDGDVANAAFAEQHGPAVCLPAAGVNLAMNPQPAVAVVDDVPIEFQVGRFTAEGRVQHVLFCQWDAWLGRGRAPTHEALEDVTGWRWARVREGRRRGDAAYIVFILPAENEAAARAWLAAWAPRWLRRR